MINTKIKFPQQEHFTNQVRSWFPDFHLLENILKQECIPVECAPSARYGMGGVLHDRDPLDRDPPGRDSLDRARPLQTGPPYRDPRDRDPKG